MITQDLFDEMLRHFKALLQFDTTNPPGNETPAAHYIASVLQSEGIECNLVEPIPGRASLIARLRGNGLKRPLLLMSHLDVVIAEKDKWEHPPFSAYEEDGYIWGRGTLDCKNTVVLWMTILIALKRSKAVLDCDVIFLAAADEEEGGQYGTGWIANTQPELIEAEAALNEGGGMPLGIFGRTFYTYQTGEKGNLWLKITTRGIAGHGSVPRADSAVEQLLDLITSIKRMSEKVAPPATMRAMIQTIAAHSNFPTNIIIRCILNPLLSNFLIRKGLGSSDWSDIMKALMNNTVATTVLKAGHKTNVIPSEASAELDIRVLPGVDVKSYLDKILEIAGPETEVEVLDIQPPSESPVNHELATSIRRVLHRHHPGAPVLPIMMPAVSDGGYLRRLNTVVYGFSPLLPGEAAERIHGHNERISIASLYYSLKIAFEVVADFAAPTLNDFFMIAL